MGQAYHFRETGGVVMDFAVQTRADIDRLSVEKVTERLSYVDKALRLLRQALGDQTALIGFAGSPWTLATFIDLLANANCRGRGRPPDLRQPWGTSGGD
jgi:uroporphyrinogen decarboxylase